MLDLVWSFLVWFGLVLPLFLVLLWFCPFLVFLVFLVASLLAAARLTAGLLASDHACVSPHMQAAGRIHRLGQSQDVLCKRFVYRQSYEERVVGLHAQLRAGTQMLTDGRISGASFRYLTAM